MITKSTYWSESLLTAYRRDVVFFLSQAVTNNGTPLETIEDGKKIVSTVFNIDHFLYINGVDAEDDWFCLTNVHDTDVTYRIDTIVVTETYKTQKMKTPERSIEIYDLDGELILPEEVTIESLVDVLDCFDAVLCAIKNDADNQ